MMITYQKSTRLYENIAELTEKVDKQKYALDFILGDLFIQAVDDRIAKVVIHEYLQTSKKEFQNERTTD